MAAVNRGGGTTEDGEETTFPAFKGTATAEDVRLGVVAVKGLTSAGGGTNGGAAGSITAVVEAGLGTASASAAASAAASVAAAASISSDNRGAVGAVTGAGGGTAALTTGSLGNTTGTGGGMGAEGPFATGADGTAGGLTGTGGGTMAGAPAGVFPMTTGTLIGATAPVTMTGGVGGVGGVLSELAILEVVARGRIAVGAGVIGSAALEVTVGAGVVFESGVSGSAVLEVTVGAAAVFESGATGRAALVVEASGDAILEGVATGSAVLDVVARGTPTLEADDIGIGIVLVVPSRAADPGITTDPEGGAEGALGVRPDGTGGFSAGEANAVGTLPVRALTEGTVGGAIGVGAPGMEGGLESAWVTARDPALVGKSTTRKEVVGRLTITGAGFPSAPTGRPGAPVIPAAVGAGMDTSGGWGVSGVGARPVGEVSEMDGVVFVTFGIDWVNGSAGELD